ncbi:acyltransferase [Kitasatospora sp. NBC_00374]|uniref:acyltransferase family protein n=1 Tax=Kitasatospora sp. NBC_00374 TaxID=2975964 RepID=UPI00324AF40E
MAIDQLVVTSPGKEAATAAPATGAPESRRSFTTRLPSLTGLRFPAALLVFAYHAGLPIPSMRVLADDAAEFDLYKVVGQMGGLGVSFFFVLSGFVLTWSARKQDTAKAFWRRRFVKIYPNYLVAWGLAMALFASAYTPIRDAVANLFMLQVWAPDFNLNFSVDPPSWSLGAEAVFYASFPLLHRLFLRIRPQHLKYWIGGAVAGIIATPALAYALLPSGPGIPGGELSSVSQYWFSYVLPPVRLLDFALGMLVAHAVMNGRWRNIGMIWSSVLLVAGYVLTYYVPYLYGQRAACIIPIVLLIAAAAVADAENRFTIFRNRTMLWLGEISFAFYLLHFVVLTYGRTLLGDRMFSAPVGAAVLVAEAGVAVLLSWALYALVERPITKRFSKPRKRSVPQIG